MKRYLSHTTPPMLRQGYAGPGLHFAAKRRPHGRGVVMIITLLALMLIAGLVFYVFNVGRAVQQRVATQNAADAVAISGAGELARSLNLVAMDNVKVARLIAYVAVLDAADEALGPAYAQCKAMRDSLKARLPKAGGDMTDAEVKLIDEQVQPLIHAYTHDLNILTPIKKLFKAPAKPTAYAKPSGALDIRAYTFFHGPAGRGKLWKAMAALDGLSQATMNNINSLTQQAATSVGHANDPGDGAALLPGDVRIPWHRGTFADFKRPVTMGRLPATTDNKRTNRGPYDTIFGRHEPSYTWKLISRGVWHQGTRTQGHGPSGPDGLKPGESSEGYWEQRPQRKKVINGYSTYGPAAWMLRDLRYGDFQQSPFYHWRDLFTQWKLDDAFDTHTTKHTFHTPVWLTRWQAIQQAADDGHGGGVGGQGKIVTTRYFVVRIESRIKQGAGGFLSPGTYTLAMPGRVVEMKGDWSVSSDPCHIHTNDPRAWQAKLVAYRQACPAFKQLSQEDQALWKSAHYERIGTKAWRFGSKMRRDGKTMWQYMYYYLLGVDVGTQQAVRNPFNFRPGDKLPAPIELGSRALAASSDQAAKRKYFTFLAVAEDAGASPAWASMFDKGRVFDHATAIAQASVFNNHSWDLWTQMWHARLVPVTGFSQWVAAADAAPSSTWSGLTVNNAAELRAYLHHIGPMSEVMLEH